MSEGIEHARMNLKHGEEFPYDAPDVWFSGDWVRSPVAVRSPDWAHWAARGIVSDLKDRRGIKHGFADVDQDVREELVQTLAEIIRVARGENVTRVRGNLGIE